jgi:hypothetical protein
MGLETAAKTLAKAIANETVQTVDVKYGQEAALLTNNAIYAAGHGVMTAANIQVNILTFIILSHCCHFRIWDQKRLPKEQHAKLVWDYYKIWANQRHQNRQLRRRQRQLKNQHRAHPHN